MLVAPQAQRGRRMMNYSLANLVSNLPGLDSSTDREGSEHPPPEGRSSAVSGTAAASSWEETAMETAQPDPAIIAEEATSENGAEPSMLEEPSTSEKAEESDRLQAEDPGRQNIPDTASQTAGARSPGTIGPPSSQLASKSQEQTSAGLQTSNPVAGRAVSDSSRPPVAGSTPAAANAPGKRTGLDSSPSISGSHSGGPRNAETAFQLDQPTQNGATAARSGAAGGAGGGDDQGKTNEAISTAGKDFMADITKNASEGRCSSCVWLATQQMLIRVQMEQFLSEVPP